MAILKLGPTMGGLMVILATLFAPAGPAHGLMPAFPHDSAVEHFPAPTAAIHRAASDHKAARGRGVRRTGLPLPRFASLRATKVNLRAGPGVRYPVEWVYQRRGLPVMITAEFDAWRKVRDWRGTVGWIHRAMLTGKRTVIATAREVVLRRKPSRDSPAVARAEAGVIARVLVCQADWCRVEAGGISGWGRREALWGTLPQEKIK